MLNRTPTMILAAAMTAFVAYQFGSGKFAGHSSGHDGAASPQDTAQPLQVQLDAQSQLLARLSSRLAQIERDWRSGADTDSHRSSTRAIAPSLPGGHPDAPAEASLAPLPGETLVDALQRQETEMKEQSQRRIADIDHGWNSEAVDPAWARQYTAELHTALTSQFGAALSVGKLDCRTTVCKLDLSTDPSFDLAELNRQLVQLAPLQNTEFSTLHPEGSDPGHVTIYLARPGGQGLAALSER